ncbi:hypothetical protein [Paracoccus litorisediminis]|uniref:Uncharacterized protein n=1 Tax=Paracoccus litorisediminis TaxID=2006130 RepID=A0A844HMI6_9RHOB|nr:hypothetical protein [Paracoccus litorisediminis]MTH61130.1 hypothetical protein [Paracoccus litorisediminis]
MSETAEVFQKFDTEIAVGTVYAEIYAMVKRPNGDSTLAEKDEEPDFYDAMLRPEDWDDSDGTPYLEVEDMTREEAEKLESEWLALAPKLSIEWIGA